MAEKTTTPDELGDASCSASSFLAEIAAEIDRATTKFPTWPTDAIHAVGVVAEEMGELQKEVMQLTYEPHKSTPETVRKEAVQLAAMSIRFLMSLGRYAYEPRPQHSQQNVPAMASADEKTSTEGIDFMTPEAVKETPEGGLPIRALFGSSVLLRRGGHAAPAPGQLRYVKATYIGAHGHQVCCRLEQDDPDACVGYCTKKGDVGWWSRSIMSLPNAEVQELSGGK